MYIVRYYYCWYSSSLLLLLFIVVIIIISSSSSSSSSIIIIAILYYVRIFSYVYNVMYHKNEKYVIVGRNGVQPPDAHLEGRRSELF